jgi:ureidoglycolate lyase
MERMSDSPLSQPRRLRVQALTRERFSRFGDVLDASGVCDHVSNGGAVEVFRNRAGLDFETEGGRASLSVVRSAPSRLPLLIKIMENHPLGSQAFAPLGGGEWLVLAAPAGRLDPNAIEAFRVAPNQGVNYRRGVWHHPLIALNQVSDFVIIERAGDGDNLALETLADPLEIVSLD